MNDTDSEQKTVLNYWINRCEAAEDFIAKSPCDYDNTEIQYEAYVTWVDAINIELPETSEEKKASEERGWTASKVKCDLCGFEWVATYHINCDKLKCKSCNSMSAFERID
jgi:hypothetical protein